jgi:hypothetical protein
MCHRGLRHRCRQASAQSCEHSLLAVFQQRRRCAHSFGNIEEQSAEESFADIAQAELA